MEPIRVLQVFAQMNRGGAETMIMNLYRKIDRTKVQFDFIVHTNDECAFDDEIRNLGGKIYRVPRYTGKNHLSYRKSWKDFFDNHPEYRIVHGHVRSTASIYLKIAKNKGLVTIAHSHSTSSGKGISAIVKNLLQYPIRYISDYKMACSLQSGVWLFGKKACSTPEFMILNNAIDTEKFRFSSRDRNRVREELSIEKNYVIGHIGRFTSLKNHDFIIKIFSELYRRDSKIVLLLVGDGEEKEKIEKKVNESNISDRVILYGLSSEVSEMLCAMDLLLFPSIFEGFPVTLVESQSSDLPCLISSNISSDVVINDNVEILDLNMDINIWVDKILDIKIKGNQRNNMVYNLIKEKGYDVSDTACKLEEYYEGLHFNF